MKSFFNLATLVAAILAVDLVAASPHLGASSHHHRSIQKRDSDNNDVHMNKLSRRSCKANPSSSSAAPPAASSPASSGDNSSSGNNQASGSCFPALDFKMPSDTPDSVDGWWCDMKDEIGFLGFSYEVTACQSASQLKTDFKNIRQKYNGRYVRLYGACDSKGFYDHVVDAAWEAGIGVHALIWFGFDGSNKWESRRDSLLSDLTSNPKAKFVTRALQFGSEPLFDGVLSPSSLASQVTSAKKKLAGVGIPVTVSDMAYGYQSHGGAQEVLDAIDLVDAHILPFFGASSTTGAAAWSFVKTNMDFFTKNAKGKKIIFTENGWPSQETSSLKPNSKFAIGSVGNMEDYFKMLDDHCEDLKAVEGGGVGWFFHLYSDSMELGYGLLKTSGSPKFSFTPKTSC